MDDPRRKARRYRIMMIVSGVVLVVSPFVGMIGTVFGMMGAFEKMGTSGIKDPDVLSEKIGETLIASAAGLGIAILGLPLFIAFAVLMVRENRKLEAMIAAPTPNPPQ